jgi:hypothetical protein
VIEPFDVPPAQEREFLAAWAAEAPAGLTLYRALREDVQPRFAALADAPEGGVLLLVSFPGEPDWDDALRVFAARRGYLGARVVRDPDDRCVGVVHWSSPLMYARTVRAEGDRFGSGRAALYARASVRADA